MKPEADDPNRPLSDRKTSDRALILPLVGLLLLLPPVAGIFQLDVRILGIPFTAFYLFVVWAALIAGAALLSWRLQQRGDWNEPQQEADSEVAGKPD
jgi:hypothetical protein